MPRIVLGVEGLVDRDCAEHSDGWRLVPAWLVEFHARDDTAG